MGNPPLVVETKEEPEIDSLVFSLSHWLGDELGMQQVSSSIPELRNIRLSRTAYPPETGIQDRYENLFPNYNISYRMFPDNYLQTAEDYMEDYVAYKFYTWEDQDPSFPPGDVPLEDLPCIFPGTPILDLDNEVINPPCGGGGDGSPRPDFGVLYPRKV